MPIETAAPQGDRDLERRVKNFLSRQHFQGLRSIQVHSEKGVVTIRGRVSSFHERQLCINCCQRVAGVIRLSDEVEVVRQTDLGRLRQALMPRPKQAVALAG